jgi:hypothetical protein
MNSIAHVVLISNCEKKEREWRSWSSIKPLRITCTWHVRALAPSKLDVRASGTAIHLRPHGGIGYHVTAAMGPRTSKLDSGSEAVRPYGITNAP